MERGGYFEIRPVRLSPNFTDTYFENFYCGFKRDLTACIEYVGQIFQNDAASPHHVFKISKQSIGI